MEVLVSGVLMAIGSGRDSFLLLLAMAVVAGLVERSSPACFLFLAVFAVFTALQCLCGPFLFALQYLTFSLSV